MVTSCNNMVKVLSIISNWFVNLCVKITLNSFFSLKLNKITKERAWKKKRADERWREKENKEAMHLICLATLGLTCQKHYRAFL